MAADELVSRAQQAQREAQREAASWRAQVLPAATCTCCCNMPSGGAVRHTGNCTQVNCTCPCARHLAKSCGQVIVRLQHSASLLIS